MRAAQWVEMLADCLVVKSAVMTAVMRAVMRVAMRVAMKVATSAAKMVAWLAELWVALTAENLAVT